VVLPNKYFILILILIMKKVLIFNNPPILWLVMNIGKLQIGRWIKYHQGCRLKRLMKKICSVIITLNINLVDELKLKKTSKCETVGNGFLETIIVQRKNQKFLKQVEKKKVHLYMKFNKWIRLLFCHKKRNSIYNQFKISKITKFNFLYLNLNILQT